MYNVLDKSCRENKIARFMYSNFSRKLFRLRDNVEKMVEPNRPQMTLWRVRYARWIPNATNTNLE